VRDYSLIGSTLLGQLAVGAFWVLLETDLILAPRFDTSHVEGITLAPLLMIFTTMSLSMGVGMALQHLESPQLVYLAIMNIRTSWLSREIVTANLCAKMAMAFTGATWLKLPSILRVGLAWLSVLAGVSFFYSMSRVYRLRTAPIWDTTFTPISFFLAAGFVGAAVLITMLVQSSYGPIPCFLGFVIILTAEVLDLYIFSEVREVSRLQFRTASFAGQGASRRPIRSDGNFHRARRGWPHSLGARSRGSPRWGRKSAS